MLGYIYSKLGSAWSEGEQTRIRQSFENMVAVNFNRGLDAVDDLNDIDELRQAKAMAQCQLFLLKLGDLAYPQVPLAHMKNIHGVFFGTPRVGDAGFAARMKVLYGGDQLLNVMHPLDTVHAYPPTSEGYADAMLKVFLKEQNGTNRRTPSAFSVLPVTRAMDKLLEKAAKSKPAHTNAYHRCRYCTRRGDHRGDACPHRKDGCALCGNKGHSTGEHRCSVCSQFGHRGRECHTQGNVGMVELLAYFRFHHYLYYNTNLKQNVEFSSE
ncbi:hypothetical protein DYB25_010111 [Aphanomyces astaci]|nr:hypothetical protein DYB25_010111 [Aphanomyces astaci]RHY39700.1 hypothetical protein DYB30_011191 [Aphanomyces astaci]RHY62440.1 hypothetical protein DYB34_012311 [Aphanomyces astaci]RHY96211.1 hypothetical protein DYB31_011966 [Aphanomyces astaci]